MHPCARCAFGRRTSCRPPWDVTSTEGVDPVAGLRERHVSRHPAELRPVRASRQERADSITYRRTRRQQRPGQVADRPNLWPSASPMHPSMSQTTGTDTLTGSGPVPPFANRHQGCRRHRDRRSTPASSWRPHRRCGSHATYRSALSPGQLRPVETALLDWRTRTLVPMQRPAVASHDNQQFTPCGVEVVPTHGAGLDGGDVHVCHRKPSGEQLRRNTEAAAASITRVVQFDSREALIFHSETVSQTFPSTQPWGCRLVRPGNPPERSFRKLDIHIQRAHLRQVPDQPLISNCSRLGTVAANPRSQHGHPTSAMTPHQQGAAVVHTLLVSEGPGQRSRRAGSQTAHGSPPLPVSPLPLVPTPSPPSLSLCRK